ncbi:nodulation protein NfeD [candidate division WOR-3 bacterium]|nr:nodulation protein NfeD [candidate division WOR-3 bacterium]
MLVFLVLLSLSPIYSAKIDGIIEPMSSDYSKRCIEIAEENESPLIIELDTPGGLDEAMREIVKAELNADVPVIVYITPSGARAASAGVFITLASHIAAMTPGTNIGAAHPVSIGQQQVGEEMAEKVVNDAVAYIRSIAEKRGRNADWAEEAVRKSVSITEREALDIGIIDLIVESREELLLRIDGMEVEVSGRKEILRTEGREVVEIKKTFRERFFSKLANPNLAYIFLILGIYGLILEFSRPGTYIPGVFGAICLLLAFFAFRMLPINYVGLGLIILSAIFFVLEVLTPTYGPLAIGGVVSLVLGSIMLIRSEAEFLQISIPLIITTAILVGGFFMFALGMAFSAMRRKPTTGGKGIIGQLGKVTKKIEKEGVISVSGELWNAESDEVIEKGEKVEVVGIMGLTLKVRRKGV